MEEEEISNSDLDEVRTEKEAKPTFIPFSRSQDLQPNKNPQSSEVPRNPAHELNARTDFRFNSRKSKSEANNSMFDFDSIKEELLNSNSKNSK